MVLVEDVGSEGSHGELNEGSGAMRFECSRQQMDSWQQAGIKERKLSTLLC